MSCRTSKGGGGLRGKGKVGRRGEGRRRRIEGIGERLEGGGEKGEGEGTEMTFWCPLQKTKINNAFFKAMDHLNA